MLEKNRYVNTEMGAGMVSPPEPERHVGVLSNRAASLGETARMLADRASTLSDRLYGDELTDLKAANVQARLACPNGAVGLVHGGLNGISDHLDRLRWAIERLERLA